MNIQEIAKQLAIQNKFDRFAKVESYDLALRDYDGMVEVIGYIPDPTYNMEDFEGREMLFPKRWVTLGVLPEETTITV